METQNPNYGKHISLLYRVGQIFYDTELAPYHIGCGQQYFLLSIAQNPGINLLALAREGFYDKGTTTRAVRKLEEAGYIRVEKDEGDHRLRKLYVTEEAAPVIEKTQETVARWHSLLTQELNAEEQGQAAALLERMAGHAYEYIKNSGKRD